MPSYTPTVRALAEARSRAPVNDGRLLAVGVPGAEGPAELRHAAVEAERIARQVPGATGLFGEHATRKALLDELPRLTHLHFAGHGAHDPVTGGGTPVLTLERQR